MPDQTVNPIFTGETVGQIVFMFIYTLNKIRRHTCIQGAIPLATKNVNIESVQLLSLDSRLRGNDISDLLSISIAIFGVYETVVQTCR